MFQVPSSTSSAFEAPTFEGSHTTFFEARETSKVVSPKKALKIYNGSKRRTKRQPNVPPASYSPTKRANDQEVTLGSEGGEDFAMDDIGMDNGGEERDDEEDAYTASVMADCAGFFQISESLFVVQGWDTKRERPTVRFTLCMV